MDGGLEDDCDNKFGQVRSNTLLPHDSFLKLSVRG